jgi:hypothetical protein
MTTIKNILVSVILSLVLLCYFGHGIFENYVHLKYEIENTNDYAGSQNFVTSESFQEVEDSFVLPVNSAQILNSGSESLHTLIIISPVKMVYPVWLPPKVS